MSDKNGNSNNDKLCDDIEPKSLITKPRSSGRRKLIIGSSAIGAMFAGRPVLAAKNICAFSGALSGPSSLVEPDPCNGLTPGYWKNHDWPAGYVKEDCVKSNGQLSIDGNGKCTWQGTEGNGVTKFADVFPNCKNLIKSVYPVIDTDDLSLTWENISFSRVLWEAKEGNSQSSEPGLQLAFHLVAALFNSASPFVNYGYTGAEFISIAENFCLTGMVPGYGALSVEQFKNLLDLRNNGHFDVTIDQL